MIELRTPTRLHFGLFAFNPEEPRQFGGVGLMIKSPRLVLTVEPDEDFLATGPLASRAVSFAKKFASNAAAAGVIDEPLTGAHIRILSAPRAHTGLGSGTQLGMAVAAALAQLANRDDLPAAALANLAGRGARSAIGAHGFAGGGLIVEGGKKHPDDLSPLLMRLNFPDPWRIVLICPKRLEGVAGEREIGAFAKMLPFPREVTAEMCRLVLLGLAPACVEHDLRTFGQSLYDLEQVVGRCFKSVQGGQYASPYLGDIVSFIREQGVAGVGQSSWGPTLYAITGSESDASQLKAAIQKRFELDDDEVQITAADNSGAQIGVLKPSKIARG